MITEFQINIFRERQNNQGVERYRWEHQWIIKHMPSVPLGKPPLGPNHREEFLVLLDGMPCGANQSDSDEGGVRTFSLPSQRAASWEEHLWAPKEAVSTWMAKQTCISIASLDWGGAWWGDPRSVQGEKGNLYLSFCPLSACLFSCPFFWAWQILKKHISKQFRLLLPVFPGTCPAPCQECWGYTEVPQHWISTPRDSQHGRRDKLYADVSKPGEHARRHHKERTSKEPTTPTCGMWAERGPRKCCRNKMASELTETSTSKVKEGWGPGNNEAGGGWHPGIWGGFRLDQGAGWTAWTGTASVLSTMDARSWAQGGRPKGWHPESTAKSHAKANTAAAGTHSSMRNCTFSEIKGTAIEWLLANDSVSVSVSLSRSHTHTHTHTHTPIDRAELFV